jgi:mannosyl-3-phosphoglycerate phosphatase
MATPSSLLIFTDLDGTLLNSDDYRYDAALPILHQLHQRGVPVIPVTSKTRQEVIALRHEIAPQDPFVVENGSAIFWVPGDRRFDLTPMDPGGDLHSYCLGCTYSEARQGLADLSQALQVSLRGFGDLTPAALQGLTGLPAQEVGWAQAREFTEPFVMPSEVSAEQIRCLVHDLGLGIVVGDRFSHLIGAGAGKGRAVQRLVAAYQAAQPGQAVYTVGLGNSPNDLPMLEAVDWPIVIPGAAGPHPALGDRGWHIAPHPGSAGWAIAVETLYAQHR